MIQSQINQIRRDIHSLEISIKRNEAKGNTKKVDFLRQRLDQMNDMVLQLQGI